MDLRRREPEALLLIRPNESTAHGLDPGIAVNNETFDAIRRNGILYADKTSMLVPLCEEMSKGTVPLHMYARSTRFGKTLNQSMIDRFFNVAYAGEPDVFDGLEISEHREFDRFRNRYPVIRLDLSPMNPKSQDSMRESLRSIVSKTFLDVRSAYGDEWMSPPIIRRFDAFSDGTVSDTDVVLSMEALCGHLLGSLRDRSGDRTVSKPVILVDEYDAFMQKVGKIPSPEFEDVAKPLAEFMVSAFKSNTCYSLGIMTGIMTLSRTGILSGLNNITIHTFLDEGSSGFFGYDDREVRSLVDACVPEGSDKERIMGDIKGMYDGYVFGKREVCNPRSVNKYLSRRKFDEPPGRFWNGIRDNSFLNSLLASAPEPLQDEIARLTMEDGRTKKVLIDQAVVYQDVYKDPTESALCSCLAMTGYLRAAPLEPVNKLDPVLCEVSLPSREVEDAYRDLIVKVRARKIRGTGFLDALYSKDSERATDEFNAHLRSMSVRDPWGHREYKEHLCMYFREHAFRAKAERDSGNGFADVVVEGDADHGIPAACIEITTAEEAGTRDLEAVETMCWRKFEDRRYGMEDPGCLLVAFAWDRLCCRIGIRTKDGGTGPFANR
ncbi:MAG: AAA family ATPase [Candidatus Methanomethylophilaceae archaeon]|nr:AAA family ATPase [Candidatus Methanomethylophilaceae archaeon]